MDPNFVATVAYPCPRCGVGLEAREEAVPGWLRCPNCGKGGMPPFANPRRKPPDLAKFAYDPEVLVIGEDTMLEPEAPWYGSARDRPGSARVPAPAPGSSRTGLTVLFCLCLSTFLVMLFVGDGFKAGLAGVAAGIALLFLVRPSRSPTRH